MNLLFTLFHLFSINWLFFIKLEKKVNLLFLRYLQQMTYKNKSKRAPFKQNTFYILLKTKGLIKAVWAQIQSFKFLNVSYKKKTRISMENPQMSKIFWHNLSLTTYTKKTCLKNTILHYTNHQKMERLHKAQTFPNQESENPEPNKHNNLKDSKN